MQIEYWVLLILQLAPILATGNYVFQDTGNFKGFLHIEGQRIIPLKAIQTICTQLWFAPPKNEIYDLGNALPETVM